MSSLALLLCAAGLAVAAPDTPTPSSETPASAPAEGDLRYEAVLRAEYLQGQPILVPIRVWNAGASTLEAPDIERRPWLVEFSFDQGKGELERRRTTPPASDPGRMVKLSPRSQRRTLLEVPASSGLKAAEYRIQVTLDPDTLPKPLATGTIRLAAPHPVEADLERSISAAARSANSTVWLHKATNGFDLYVSPFVAQRRAQWLAHLDTEVQPMLSEASGGEGGARHVVWPKGDRGIGWLSVEGPGVEATPRMVETPWPKVELVGRPATDAAGNLHVPIWVPAPKGSGGELRVLTVLDRGAVSYRRASRFKAKPVAFATTVDDAGAVQLLVTTPEATDLYTIRQLQAAHSDLPIPGRRVARAEPGAPLVDARFGLRAGTTDQKGGLAVLTTARTAEGLQSTWLGLRGSTLQANTAVAPPENGELVDILPSESGTTGYLFKTGSREARYIEGPHTLTFEESLHGDWGLARAKDGTPTLVRTAKGALFVVKPLLPEG